ncbi:MAG: Clp protease N-terminal domain-containing protein [Gaiellaceae bacterium]
MRWRKSGEQIPESGSSIDIPRLERELGVRIGARGKVVLSLACVEMDRSNHRELGAEHVIVGVLEEGGPAAQLLIEHGMTLDEARAQIAEALWEAGDSYGEVELTSEAANILATAAEAAGMRGHSAIEPEHMTYGFACSGFEITSRVLHMVGVDRPKLLKASESLLSQNGH